MKIKEFIKIFENLDYLNNNNAFNARQNLWHAIAPIHAAEQLEKGMLEPHTSHRYWPDGIRRKEDDPKYENSFWMYGWSTTRKKEYAFGWGSVVFELSHDKIAQNFEIMPISWNNLFKHHTKFQKKEFEEFIIAKHEAKSIEDYKNEELKRDIEYDRIYNLLDDQPDNQDLKDQLALIPELSWFQAWQEPKGRSIDLNKCLKAIYINDEDYEMAMNDKNGTYYENISKIIEHPKFAGLFKSPHKMKYEPPKP